MFLQNLALNPCWDCLERSDRSTRPVRPIYAGRQPSQQEQIPSRAWTYKKPGIYVLQSISNNINKSLHTSRAHPSRSSGSTIQTQNYKCKVSKSNRNRDDAMKTRWFVWLKFGFTLCTHVWIMRYNKYLAHLAHSNFAASLLIAAASDPCAAATPTQGAAAREQNLQLHLSKPRPSTKFRLCNLSYYVLCIWTITTAVSKNLCNDHICAF